MTHSDAVVNGYRVELGSKTSEFLDLLLDYLAYLVEMGVTGYKLSE